MKWLFASLLTINFFDAFSQNVIASDSMGLSAPTLPIGLSYIPDQLIENINEQMYETPPMLQKVQLDVNQVTEEQLLQTGKLTVLQVVSFLNYREKLGQFEELEELQAVPYWDLLTAKLMAEIMEVHPPSIEWKLKKKWTVDATEWIMVTGLTPQMSKAFKADSTTGKSHYKGPPLSFMLRLSQKLTNGIQWGLCLENDKGEPFLFQKNQLLFDHVSKSVSYQSDKLLNRLIIGDYQVNIGMGLAQWQSFGMGQHTTDISSLINHAPVVKAYWGKGEDNYHSGIATTFQKGRWTLSAWISNRKKDAVLRQDTTKLSFFVTSLIITGLHRSESEMGARKTIKEKSAGMRLGHQKSNLKLGLNVLGYSWSHPINYDTSRLSNHFSFHGNRLFNFSLDGKWAIGNLYCFGEASLSHPGGAAIVSGCIISMSEKLDLAMLYRNISKRFESRYASSYTVSYQVQNETGLSFLLNHTFSKKMKCLLRVDLIKIPWLNDDELKNKNAFNMKLAANFNPSKRSMITMMYSRKENDNGVLELDSTAHKENSWVIARQLDLDVKHQFSKQLIFKSQITVKSNKSDSWGWLMSAGLNWKWTAQSLKIGTAVAFFHVSDYSHRVYLVENELFNTIKGTSLFDYGNRYMFHIEKKWAKNLAVSFYISHNQYFNKKNIGSGFDLIEGSGKTDITAGIKWQL